MQKHAGGNMGGVAVAVHACNGYHTLTVYPASTDHPSCECAHHHHHPQHHLQQQHYRLATHRDDLALDDALAGIKQLVQQDSSAAGTGRHQHQQADGAELALGSGAAGVTQAELTLLQGGGSGVR